MPLSPVRKLRVIRSALFFDGVDDYIEVPDSPSLRNAGGSKRTLEILFRLVSNKRGTTNTIITLTDTDNVVSIYFDSAGYMWIYFVTIEGSRPVGLGAYDTDIQGAWTHIFAIYDGAGIIGHRDDFKTGPWPLTGAFADNPVTLKAPYNYDKISYYIAIIRLYNKALSDSEVAWNREHPDNPVRTGLVLWLHNTSIEDTIWRDISGYNNHATIYGATKVDFLYSPVRIQTSVREQSVIR